MKKRVLLVDNVDSFTFNLVQAIRTIGADVVVRRANELEPAEAEDIAPTHVVISPGPGHPRAATGSLAVAAAFLERVPLLGVCLGHQCLGFLAGAEVKQSIQPEHGKSIRVYHDGRAPFRGLPNPFEAGRYHSLIVSEENLGPDFEVSAWSTDGEVLGLRHRTLPVFGTQFHPESLLTPMGSRILTSFLALSSSGSKRKAVQTTPAGKDSPSTDEVPA